MNSALAAPPAPHAPQPAPHSHAASFALTLREAEQKALSSSNRLKAAGLDETAAREQANAQYQALLPHLSFQANYTYLAQIPIINLGGLIRVPFGTNSVYTFGPQLTYTLFDGFSSQKAYTASHLLEEAREEDRKNSERQLLLNTRAAYVQVQLGLEELRLIQESRELALAQHHDVLARFHAGAAARLELVTAERSVLSYDIQFKQRQADLSSSLRDLLAIINNGPVELADSAVAQPGPEGVLETRLVLRLDPLGRTLDEQARTPLDPPTDAEPQLQSPILQARSLRENAESQSSHALPTVQLSAAVNYNRPDVPNPPSYWQESIGAGLSMPIFLGDPTRYQAAQLRAQADAADFRVAQMRLDLDRDFGKAREELQSLWERRRLAASDVSQSEIEARLYYTSYKAGKIQFIYVQNSNLQALQAKVYAARIDAQILNQIILLRSLSGKGDRS